MKNKPRIISVKVLYVENSVERPKVFLNKEHVADAAASASNNSWPADSTLMVSIANSAGTDQRKVPSDSFLRRQVESPLEGRNIAKFFGLPPVLHSSDLMLPRTFALSASSLAISSMIAFGHPSFFQRASSTFLKACSSMGAAQGKAAHEAESIL